MFDRFGDLPLHVLVIHATVVVLPVSALVSIVFAAVPKWRWLLRWPTLLLGTGSFVLAFVAKQSGKAFLKAKPALAQIIHEHETRGDLLFWFALAFMIVAIAAAFLLTGPSALASGRGARTGGRRPVELIVSAGLVVIAIIVVVQTVRTGDAGAKAVWNGTFSS